VCNGCENELHRDQDDIFIMVANDKEVPYCNACLTDDEYDEDDY